MIKRHGQVILKSTDMIEAAARISKTSAESMKFLLNGDKYMSINFLISRYIYIFYVALDYANDHTIFTEPNPEVDKIYSTIPESIKSNSKEILDRPYLLIDIITPLIDEDSRIYLKKIFRYKFNSYLNLTKNRRKKIKALQ